MTNISELDTRFYSMAPADFSKMTFDSAVGRSTESSRRNVQRLESCRQSSTFSWRSSPSLLRLLVIALTAFLVDFVVRPPFVSGCIMLLDGWTPMSPGERAVLADIVAYGVVRRTFKDVDLKSSSSPHQGSSAVNVDPANTYTAEVSLVRVVKGRDLVEAIYGRQRVGTQVNRDRDFASATNRAYSTPNPLGTDDSSKVQRRRNKRVSPARGHGDTRVPPSERQPTKPTPRTTTTTTATMTTMRPDSVDVSAPRWPRGGRHFNITNFGESSACYADVANDVNDVDGDSDVQRQQQRHVFFLTTFDGHLSARYDDLFGAAADWSRDAEEEIDDALGWTPWSDWSACGTTCGGGIQKRWRLCTEVVSGCEGDKEQQRKCNEFRCKGSKDLLALAAITSLPSGVRRADDRPSAYVIDRSTSINMPLSKIVPQGFPANYSLLITARQKPSSGADAGYLLTVNDLFGFVHVGVRLGRSFRIELSDQFALRFHSADGATPRGGPPLENSGDDRGLVAVEFPVDLADGAWHQVAIAVQTGSHVMLYVDCQVISTQRWVYRSSAAERTPIAEDTEDSVMTIGKSFIENSRYPHYEGDVEQLTLVVDNMEAANQQCENIDEFLRDQKPHTTKSLRQGNYEWVVEQSNFDLISLNIERLPDAETVVDNVKEDKQIIHGQQASIPPPAFETSWSEWSPCSSTCGTGVEARILYCKSVSATADDGRKLQKSSDVALRQLCPDDVTAKTETRPCRTASSDAENCSGIVRCRKPCFNGGTCLPDGGCLCNAGYFGRHCQTPSCYPLCRHGGHCIDHNRCSCRHGYSGDHCQIAKCRTECQNGGWCVRPGQCACPRGHQPPDCSPICDVPCVNGGSCVAYNRCHCRQGFTGSHCETAVCRIPCENGGQCTAPNRCSCTANFTGRQCRRPVCNPQCLNGGVCASPGTCQCPAGTYGSTCELFACSPPCLNNGVCIGLNTCLCSQAFSGELCQTGNCSRGCNNGGTCLGGILCQCTDEFDGPTCSQRKCRKETVQINYQRPYNKLVAKQVSYKCGMLGWRTCTKTRYEYQTALKPATKTIERCT